MLRSGLINRAAIIVIAGCLGLPVMPALAQSQLPPCPTDQNARRHMCQGTRTFPSGNRYVGEYRDNKRNGQGTFTFASGDRYVGEFRDDKAHGQGTYTSANGDRFVGEYRDNEANGRGTYTFANGDRYVGEYRDDKRNGQGTFTFANGDRYVGEWRDGKYHGQGTFTLANGDRYVGEYRDDKRNGQGTFTFANGDRYVGEWRDNQFVQANNLPNPASSAQRPAAPSAPSAPPASSSGTSVRLIRDAGTFKVPVRINGVLELKFTVDSGASDVTIPADVVMTLIRTGTIRDSDFIGEQTYRLADGSTVKSRTFRIRQLQVGSRTIENVLGSVANVEGSLLLGQSFLSRFRRVSFDYAQGVLVLE